MRTRFGKRPTRGSWQLIRAARTDAGNSRRAHDCRAVESIDELANDPDIQAVCVTTPSGAHAEAAVPLLEAGKAVLCEKPLEVSLEAVDRILDAAHRGGGVIAGVFQMRLGRGAQLLKAAINAGTLRPADPLQRLHQVVASAELL